MAATAAPVTEAEPETADHRSKANGAAHPSPSPIQEEKPAGSIAVEPGDGPDNLIEAQDDISAGDDTAEEPEERTGFDDLADAAWQRVQSFSPNGASVPLSAIAAMTPASPPAAESAPEPVAAPAVEPVASQAVEALNDGGSESRRSGTYSIFAPIYIAADTAHHPEPPAKIAPAAEAETVGTPEGPAKAAELNESAATEAAAGQLSAVAKDRSAETEEPSQPPAADHRKWPRWQTGAQSSKARAARRRQAPLQRSRT